jgi:PAS domain S-box-containing protein
LNDNGVLLPAYRHAAKGRAKACRYTAKAVARSRYTAQRAEDLTAMTRVQIIDDSTARTDALRALLASHGYDVEVTQRSAASNIAIPNDQEAWLHSMVNAGPVLMWAGDLEKRCVYFNQPWLNFTGRTLEQEMGMGWTVSMHPDDLPRFISLYATAFEARTPFELEFRLRRHDGEYRWRAGRAAPYFDSHGAFQGFIGSCVDITDLKQAVSVRNQLFNVSHDLMCVATFGDYFSDLNPAWTKTLGWTIAELKAKPWMSFVHPDDQEATRSIVAVLEDGQAVLNFDNRYRHKDGSYRWLSWKTVILPEERIIFAIARDVTEQRALQAQLLQSQKMQAIGTLAGGIAHDFNNLLSAIIGNAELARMDLSEVNAAQLAAPQASAVLASLTSMTEVLRAGQRAKELVQRILSFSRPQEMQLKPIQLHDVLQEAVNLLRATLPAGIALHLDSTAVVPVRADASQIHQIVLNLATNAWHAMEHQTGHIDIALTACNVDSTLCKMCPDLHPGPHVRLSVSDTGKGMEATTLARIFEPFFTTKPIGKGVGLGLSVVHGIVAGHHGGIVVESELGKGTTIHLYFPTSADAAEAAAVEQITAHDLPGQQQHILYIDDEEPLVFLAVRFLERLGYRVDGFTQVSQALAAFRANPKSYDLVITDYNMPALSGMDLAQQLLSIRADTPIALASGYVRPDDVERARAVGIREIILKPNTVEELGPLVQRLLATSASAE